MWFVDSTGKLRRALVDTSGHIQIDILSSPLSALIGEVQASPTTYTVLDRLKTLATLLNAGLPSALDTGALKVREQNWPTEIDVDIAKILNTAVSLTNYLPVGVAYPAGTLIDPRDVSDRAARLLGIVYGSQGQKLQQKATTYELLTYDSFIAAILGEVQAVPTSYTIQDRLKGIQSSVDGLEGLLAGGLPSALTSDKLKVRASEIETLLAGGLPSALTSYKLKVRASEIETLLNAGLPAALDTGALKTREQNPLTELAANITKVLGTAVSLTNYLPVGVVYPAGTLINPQSIRALTSSDVVDVSDKAAREVGRVYGKTGDPLFSVEDVYAETVSNVNAGAGTNYLLTTAVPANKKHIYTSITSRNDISAMTASSLQMYRPGVAVYFLHQIAATVRYASCSIHGWIVLKAGDYIQASFLGCTLGDDIYLEVNGFVMDA